VTVLMATRRMDMGLRCAVLSQYNATLSAFRKVCVEQGVGEESIPKVTFNRFAKQVADLCHRGVPALPPRGTSMATLVAESSVLKSLSLLQGVFQDNAFLSGSRASMAAAKRAGPRATDAGLPARIESILSDLVDAAGPPEYMTWAGLYERWFGKVGPGRCPEDHLRAWTQYVSALQRVGLLPLGSWHLHDIAQHLALHAEGSKAPSSSKKPVDVYDWVLMWQACTAVRLRLYDTFYNAFRLELAWYPERFDFSRGVGTMDVLLVDEAQDLPYVDSVYLPHLHAAWNVEAWYIGDPHQQIYDYRGSTNMLANATHAARSIAMTKNFRNPPAVIKVLHQFVTGLPHITVMKPDTCGKVSFLDDPPSFESMRDALVMFRGNSSMLLTAAKHFAHTGGRRVGLAKPVLARVYRAWRRWTADTSSHLLRKTAAGFGSGAGAGAGAGAMHDTASMIALALQADVAEEEGGDAFLSAFSLAEGEVLKVMLQAPHVWLEERDEAVDWGSVVGVAPMFSTVHSCKGQGHPNVVLMQGIVLRQPKHVKKQKPTPGADMAPGGTKQNGWPITSPEGRLMYTAITRASDKLRIVLPGSAKGCWLQASPEPESESASAIGDTGFVDPDADTDTEGFM
jgi:hypothetical protein